LYLLWWLGLHMLYMLLMLMLVLLLLLLGALSNRAVSSSLFENLWPSPAQRTSVMAAIIPVGHKGSVWVWVRLHYYSRLATRPGQDRTRLGNLVKSQTPCSQSS
jgi:hypothetical protein